MRPMSNFERKYGRYAIKNLSLILIICYAVGYVMEIIPVFAWFQGYLTLNPYAILHGQVWRLVTWILIPPSRFDFFTLIMLYFYYSIGTTLERTWGTYRYNVYLLSGMLFTIAGSFVLMGYGYLADRTLLTMVGSEVYFQQVSWAFSTYYVNMSIFLAFAATFPEMQVLLMMIIPIKVKWLGIIYGAMLVYSILTQGAYGRIVIIASLLNFVVFWLTSGRSIHLSPKQIKRRQQFKREVHRSEGITKHKCAVCGRTERDDPNLEFRFCSKCDGNYEYCQEHLFTHRHVKKR